MKKHDRFESSTLFEGRCTLCNELYQAQSKSDDLEGITFKCKKVSCKGRVSLKFAHHFSLPSRALAPNKPSRFC